MSAVRNISYHPKDLVRIELDLPDFFHAAPVFSRSLSAGFSSQLLRPTQVAVGLPQRDRNWFCGVSASLNAFPRVLQSAFDVTRSSASGDVVQREHLGEPEARLKICVKLRVNFLQIGERKLLQVAPALHRQRHRLADGFMGEARRHSAFDQIGGRRPGVHKS